MKRHTKYDAIKKLTKEDREEILKFALKRSKEILSGEEEEDIQVNNRLEEITKEA
jgi:hypothetical protein